MKAISGEIRLSASDLSNHLACHHLTSLNLAVSLGAKPAPAWRSPDAEVLQERGMANEDAYLKHLEAQGVSVLNLRDIEDSVRIWEGSPPGRRPRASFQNMRTADAVKGEGAEGAQH